jgi:hypothetical protein
MDGILFGQIITGPFLTIIRAQTHRDSSMEVCVLLLRYPLENFAQTFQIMPSLIVDRMCLECEIWIFRKISLMEPRNSRKVHCASRKSSLNCRTIAAKLTHFLGNMRRLLHMNHEDDPSNGSWDTPAKLHCSSSKAPLITARSQLNLSLL